MEEFDLCHIGGCVRSIPVLIFDDFAHPFYGVKYAQTPKTWDEEQVNWATKWLYVTANGSLCVSIDVIGWFRVLNSKNRNFRI